MSGHSKWSTIKRKKAKVDAERGKVFTKLIKEITIAARHGGSDEDSNPRLRSAVLAAKAANMPAANIERAVKKGTGELPGVVYEEKIYEGYGPGGVAVIVDALTDNTNRTTSEIRHAFSKHNGNLGETGCVNWMFEKNGLITVKCSDADEETLMEIVLETGADDMSVEDDVFEIVTSPEVYHDVLLALDNANISVNSSELTMLPQNTVKIEGGTAEQVLRLMDMLEDNDDVQNVYANFDFDENEG